MYLKTISSGSKGNCYLLFEKDDIYILDCGIPYRQILPEIMFKLNRVKGIFVTHEHSDHATAVKDFVRFGAKVFAPGSVAKKFDGVTELQPKKRYKIGGLSVVPIELPHDGCMNFGYYFQFENKKKLLYATDFEYIPLTFRNDNIEHFLIECNHINDYIDRDIGYLEHSVRGHSSLNTVEEFLKLNSGQLTENVILCHMSQNQCDPEVCRSSIAEILAPGTALNIASPGLIINLDKETENE